MPKPVAAPTNKLFPMHYSGPRFCIPCMAGLRFPALVVKMCFSGPSGQSPLFCRIHPVQMHHPHLIRLVPSRQSACHRPLMHAAHLNPRIQMRSESDEAHHYLLCSPRTLIEAWVLECVLYKKYSGCCDMGENALHLMHWERPPYPPNTIHEHIRRPYHFSCSLLFVLRTYMSMLLDYVIQHGIDGAHRQLCTLSYMMGDYHQVLSRLEQ